MKKLIPCALLAIAPMLASASTLSGDTVTFSANPGVFGPVSAAVGIGSDLSAGNFSFNFNFGPGGDGLLWTSLPNAGDLAGSTSFTISDMDFSDGTVLAGFDLRRTQLSDLSFSFTDDSITFSYTSTGFIGPGIILLGEFLTRAVPLPATLPLALLGLAALGLARRRAGRPMPA